MFGTFRQFSGTQITPAAASVLRLAKAIDIPYNDRCINMQIAKEIETCTKTTSVFWYPT